MIVTMTSLLLSPRLCAAGAKRSYSFLASSATTTATTARLPDFLISQNNYTRSVNASRRYAISAANNKSSIIISATLRATSYNSNITQHHQQQQQSRNFSKYASVDHSSAYNEAINSSHGQQLQLALEEGRGKDDAPFDPFSAFLDEMGQTVDSVDDDSGGNSGDNDHIEEAEFKEYVNQEENEDDDDELDDDDEHEPMYDTTGALLRPKSERLALRAGYPSGGNFAVIYLSGFQHKVTKDDLLVVNKLKPVSQWSVGSTHTIKGDDVFLVANQYKTCVGLPGVKGAEVDVMVEEITRDKTLVIFKKRRRKNSRRKNGFRRQVTFLRVLDVRMPEGEEVGADGGSLLESESMAA